MSYNTFKELEMYSYSRSVLPSQELAVNLLDMVCEVYMNDPSKPLRLHPKVTVSMFEACLSQALGKYRMSIIVRDLPGISLEFNGMNASDMSAILLGHRSTFRKLVESARECSKPHTNDMPVLTELVYCVISEHEDNLRTFMLQAARRQIDWPN